MWQPAGVGGGAGGQPGGWPCSNYFERLEQQQRRQQGEGGAGVTGVTGGAGGLLALRRQQSMMRVACRVFPQGHPSLATRLLELELGEGGDPDRDSLTTTSTSHRSSRMQPQPHIRPVVFGGAGFPLPPPWVADGPSIPSASHTHTQAEALQLYGLHLDGLPLGPPPSAELQAAEDEEFELLYDLSRARGAVTRPSTPVGWVPHFLNLTLSAPPASTLPVGRGREHEAGGAWRGGIHLPPSFELHVDSPWRRPLPLLLAEAEVRRRWGSKWQRQGAGNGGRVGIRVGGGRGGTLLHPPHPPHPHPRDDRRVSMEDGSDYTFLPDSYM